MSRGDNPTLKLFMASNSGHDLETSWIVDSPQMVVVGNGSSIPATAVGRVELEMDLGNGKTGNVLLQNVYYVPDLNSNLLSVAYLASRDITVVFVHNKCKIEMGGETQHSTRIAYGPSPVTNPTLMITALTATSSNSKASLETWH